MNTERCNRCTVSITTCLYERGEFLPNLIQQIKNQDYPHALLFWLILDDSKEPNPIFQGYPQRTDSTGRVVFDLDGIAVYYYHLPVKQPLGLKRTALNGQCQGDYIAIFDDDDYYPPSRISSSVRALGQNPGYAIAGCSRMYMYFTGQKTIYQIGPYGPNHATAASLIYTRAYAQTHAFKPENQAEEGAFTNGWTEPLLQLDPRQTLLAMAHGKNTINKEQFLGPHYLGRLIHVTPLNLVDFIQEPDVLEFFLKKE